MPGPSIPQPTTANPGSSGARIPPRRTRQIVLVIVAVAAVAILGSTTGWTAARDQALGWIRDLGPWGPVLFIALYVVAAVLLVPGSALTLGAGAAFGLVPGTFYASIASTLGATAAFLVGRRLGRSQVARWLGESPRLAAIDQAVGKGGWRVVLLTRLSPAFPFTLLNYAFGLSQVRLPDYVLASWIGMLPGTVLYVHLGSLAHADVNRPNATSGEWAVRILGLLATLVVTVMVTRLARRALQSQGAPQPSVPGSPNPDHPAE